MDVRLYFCLPSHSSSTDVYTNWINIDTGRVSFFTGSYRRHAKSRADLQPHPYMSLAANVAHSTEPPNLATSAFQCDTA
jgi:hypothetical protein